jgi:hypothetical protein
MPVNDKLTLFSSSSDAAPPKSGIFSSFSAAPSQPAKLFGGSSAVVSAVDTPDLFKNVAGATTKPTTSTRTPISRSTFGNPFGSATSAPQPVFGIKSDKGRIFGGEPMAKKPTTSTDSVTTGNIFGAKTSDNRIFSQPVKQSGAVIPLFGKPGKKNGCYQFLHAQRVFLNFSCLFCCHKII